MERLLSHHARTVCLWRVNPLSNCIGTQSAEFNLSTFLKYHRTRVMCHHIRILRVLPAFEFASACAHQNAPPPKPKSGATTLVEWITFARSPRCCNAKRAKNKNNKKFGPGRSCTCFGASYATADMSTCACKSQLEQQR